MYSEQQIPTGGYGTFPMYSIYREIKLNCDDQRFDVPALLHLTLKMGECVRNTFGINFVEELAIEDILRISLLNSCKILHSSLVGTLDFMLNICYSCKN